MEVERVRNDAVTRVHWLSRFHWKSGSLEHENGGPMDSGTWERGTGKAAGRGCRRPRNLEGALCAEQVPPLLPSLPAIISILSCKVRFEEERYAYPGAAGRGGCSPTRTFSLFSSSGASTLTLLLPLLRRRTEREAKQSKTNYIFAQYIHREDYGIKLICLWLQRGRGIR
jgi:hypothetical protein